MRQDAVKFILLKQFRYTADALNLIVGKQPGLGIVCLNGKKERLVDLLGPFPLVGRRHGTGGINHQDDVIEQLKIGIGLVKNCTGYRGAVQPATVDFA